MLLIHQGDAPRPGRNGESNEAAVAAFESLSQEEQGAIRGAWRAIGETPGVTPGLRLEPPETATTVRVKDGRRLVTDGPFAEAKEAIGGYLVFEAGDLDAALDLAARIPTAAMGGAVEVRPVAER
jgi:hypothetical protein